MRTDVKVGLICLFAIVLGVVIYFVAQGNAHPRDAKADSVSVTPAGAAGAKTLDVAKPAATPTVTVAPVTPAAPTANAATLVADAGTAHTTPAAPQTFVAQASPGGGAPMGGGIIPAPSAPGSNGPMGTPVSPAPPLNGGLPGAGPTTMPSFAPPTPTTPPLGGMGGAPMHGSIEPLVPAGRPEVPTPAGGSETWGGRPSGGLGSGMSGGGRTGGRVPGGGASNAGGLGASNGGTNAGGMITSSAGGTTHKIEKGDMLGTIAKKYGTTVAAIEKANPGIDSTKLKVGVTINIPAASAMATHATTPMTPTAAGTAKPPTTRPSSGKTAGGSVVNNGKTNSTNGKIEPGSTYTVKKGDTLGTIAQAAYGDKKAWNRIFRANRGELEDANTITVGTVLRIPS